MYVGIFSIAVIFSLRGNVIKDKRLFFILYFVVYSVMSFVVRFSGFDEDINTYADAMSYNAFSLYFLKEPVIWFGQRWLFMAIESETAVFIFTDIFFGLILYSTLSRFKSPQYIYFSILLFFPFVLGFQNVYRQWVGEILFLFSISLVYRNKFSSLFVYVLSMASHNVAGVFLPVYLRGGDSKLWKMASLSILLMMPVILILTKGTKSSASTGANLTIAYLFLLGCITLFFILSRRGIIKKSEKMMYSFLFYYLFICFSAVLLLSSTSAERVVMFALIASYPSLGNRIEERFLFKVPLRLFLLSAGFLPIFLFGTRKFLI